MEITKVKISRLQFITQNSIGRSHESQVKQACKAGIRWVQLRVKNKSFGEWLPIAKEVKSICDTYGAILIINDNVDICLMVNADGVHLGKGDMSIAQARNVLEDNKIIGGTANSKFDVVQLMEEGVDYIGLGPYRYTKTKKFLSPILGMNGVQRGISQAGKFPIVAIGGIIPGDIPEMVERGIYGIAVSSAISEAKSIEKSVQSFIQSFQYAGIKDCQ